MKQIKYQLTITALLLSVALLLVACGTINVGVENAQATLEVEQVEPDRTQDQNEFSDLKAFQEALLPALEDRNAAMLQAWMAEPFFSGTWRVELSDVSPEDALQVLFDEQLGVDNHLKSVEGVDLELLIGGIDPLSIPGDDRRGSDVFLVSGWGLDGRDESLFFVDRQANDSLLLSGWIVFKGGISGSRQGGVQPYNNFAHGYSLFFPVGYEITTQSDGNVVFLSPDDGHERGLVFIAVEPANGLTSDQVVESVKASEGEGFNIDVTAMNIEDATAFIVSGLPGQDLNRQIFMVHHDLLYHLTFIPDDPAAGNAYESMEDLFAMIVNTFHFNQ